MSEGAPDMQYEPFGEPAGVAPASPLGRGVARAGVGLFWVLVAGIVTARALLFVPHVGEGWVSAAAQTLRAVLGWA